MSRRMVFNGIDATTGDYATPPVDSDHLAKILLDQPLEDVQAEKARLFEVTEETAALRDGYDPKNLTESGWGILFAQDADPKIVEALEPLISLRRGQVNDDRRFALMSGESGYHAGDTKIQFLKRAKVTPAGPVDPDSMPYYLLIVGSPSEIPFAFQYQIDVAYAVGRLHFDDVSRYRNYAESVVKAETELAGVVRTGFFGTAHANDGATQRSNTDLVLPLASAISEKSPGTEVDHFGPDRATKDDLSAFLANGGSPRLAFTATHGMEATGHPEQRSIQGALICQNWPGWGHPPEGDHFFAGSDVDQAADYTGMVAFLFACYGGGTPQFFDFPSEKPVQLADAPFVGALPQALLGCEGGGALAVVGHIDKVWTYSFDWPDIGPQTAIFEDTLLRMLSGYPVGYAMEMFNERYAELAVSLHDSDDLIGTADELTADEVAGLWTAKNDSRNYATFGDPAVKVVAS